MPHNILGNIELALYDLSPNSPAYIAIYEAHSAGQRGSRLTQPLLAYAGKTQFALEQLNLNNLAAGHA